VSQENVELVRSLHPPPDADLARNFRDERRWAAMSGLFAPVLAPDFRCVAHGYLEGDGETFPGLEGLRYLWREWLTPWESYRTEVEQMIDLDDRVLVLVRDFGTRAEDDHEVAASSASIWTVRDGKVAEVVFCAQRSIAYKALGLEEPPPET
jgi:ketosteroid isomerase-like protein